MAVICKVVLNDDMRRFELAYPLSLSALLESVVAKFGLERSAKLRIVWIDSDGDHITICSDAALVEAFSTTSGAPLRLQLVPAATPLLASAVSTPSAEPAAREFAKEDTAHDLRLQRAQLKLAHLRAFRARLVAREQAMQSRTNAMQGHLTSERARLDEREQRILTKFPELASMPPLDGEAMFDLRKKMKVDGHCGDPLRRFGCDDEDRTGEFGGRIRGGGCPRFFSRDAPSSVICDDCQSPITRLDVRFKCGDCNNFDLCAICEPKTTHDATHVLLKLRPEAQVQRPFLPVHRPMLRPKWGGNHHGFGGRHGSPHHGPHDGHRRGPFGGRFGCRRGRFAGESEAPSVTTDPLASINKVFEQLLPQIQEKLAAAGLTEFKIKELFDQLLQTVQASCPALIEQLTQIAHDLTASATEITIETVLPRLEQLVQSVPDMLTPDLMNQLIANVLPTVGTCLSQVRLGLADLEDPFRSLWQAAPEQQPAPTPATPEHEAEDFSPLAALSIPPEILDQLTQIAANPQEALALWEAMQQ